MNQRAGNNCNKARKSAEELTTLGDIQEKNNACKELLKKYDDSDAKLIAVRQFISSGETGSVLLATDNLDFEKDSNELIKYRMLVLAEKQVSTLEHEVYKWFTVRSLSEEHYTFFRDNLKDFTKTRVSPLDSTDSLTLPPTAKLIVQLIAAGIVTLSGFRFTQIFNWHLPLIISYILTFGWIIGVINAYNLIDGLDGLCGTLSITTVLTLGVLFLLTKNPEAGLCFILAGSILGFLCFNWPPAKLFMGDDGSQFLGFMIAVIPLYTSSGNSFEFNKFLIMIIVTSFPVCMSPKLISSTKELLSRFTIQELEAISAKHLNNL